MPHTSMVENESLWKLNLRENLRISGAEEDVLCFEVGSFVEKVGGLESIVVRSERWEIER